MASATVKSAGGEVKTQDGSLAVQVPSGALDHDVKITVESATAPASGSVGTVFEIGPTGTQFKQPVTMALKYGDIDMSDLRVATYADGAWQVLPNYAVDTEHHTISGTTLHLSPYALVRVMCASAAEGGGCFVPSGQTCSTRSVVCSGTSMAPNADSGSGGSGSSSGGAGTTALDAGAPDLDASMKADEPAPAPPPPSDIPPEKQDPFAPPSTDAGTGGGTAVDGGTTADGGMAADGGTSTDKPADAGEAPIDMPIEKPPVDSSCEQPTCESAPPCGGVPGATRSACHDTATGFEETCCFAAAVDAGAPNSAPDAGVDVGAAGTDGKSGETGTMSAPDASVQTDPNAPKTETGGSGADAGSGGTSGADGADASVPPQQPPKM